MPAELMPPRTQATPQMEIAKPPVHYLELEGASHYSPLATPQQSGKPFQPTPRSRTSLRQGVEQTPDISESQPRENTPSVPTDNTNHSGRCCELRQELR